MGNALDYDRWRETLSIPNLGPGLYSGQVLQLGYPVCSITP